MHHPLKKRFIKYLSDHFSRMSSKEIDRLFDIAVERVVENSHFSEKVLKEVIKEMSEEGYPRHEILAHIEIIDIEYRT